MRWNIKTLITCLLVIFINQAKAEGVLALCNDGGIASAWNYNNLIDAEEAAIKNCKAGGNIASDSGFSNSCFAIAQDSDTSASAWASRHQNERSAEIAAINICKNSGATNCKITAKACDTVSPKKLPMQEVINSCNKKNNSSSFSDLSECIKTTYSKIGTMPSSPNVSNFYVFMDEINEKVNKKQITFVGAKAEMIRAYQNTIQASNNANQQEQIIPPMPIPGPDTVQIENQRRIDLMRESQKLLSPPPSVNARCTSTVVGNSIQTNCY